MPNFFDPAYLISRVLILLIALPVHELAHAWAADELGDDTPRSMGRLTLNPLAHLDPLGTILLLFGTFGWAKPVPVNVYKLRNGMTGLVLVAAAGPASNLVLALIAAIPFRLNLLSFSSPFADIVAQFILINLSLLLFNLIPIVPLDGSKILRGVAPREWDGWLSQLEQYGPILLMLVVVSGVTRFIIEPPLIFLFRLVVQGF